MKRKIPNEFFGEITKVSSKKKQSLDIEYSFEFVTNEPGLMDLGKEPYTTVFKITIEKAKN